MVERTGSVATSQNVEAFLLQSTSVALHERDTDIQSVLEALREASTTCEQHIRASGDLGRGKRSYAIAVQEVSAANNQIADAESDQVRERTARAEIVPLAELADEAVSPEAVHLRSLLTPNSACPVCGTQIILTSRTPAH